MSRIKEQVALRHFLVKLKFKIAAHVSYFSPNTCQRKKMAALLIHSPAMSNQITKIREQVVRLVIDCNYHSLITQQYQFDWRTSEISLSKRVNVLRHANQSAARCTNQTANFFSINFGQFFRRLYETLMIFIHREIRFII